MFQTFFSRNAWSSIFLVLFLLSQSAFAEEPKQPIVKTIIGSVLIGGSAFTMSLGGISMYNSTPQSDPHGIGNLIGGVLLVGGGCFMVPGGILLGTSLHQWQVYHRWERGEAGTSALRYETGLSYRF